MFSKCFIFSECLRVWLFLLWLTRRTVPRTYDEEAYYLELIPVFIRKPRIIAHLFSFACTQRAEAQFSPTPNINRANINREIGYGNCARKSYHDDDSDKDIPDIQQCEPIVICVDGIT